mgnify:CR=1 FL=1
MFAYNSPYNNTTPSSTITTSPTTTTTTTNTTSPTVRPKWPLIPTVLVMVGLALVFVTLGVWVFGLRDDYIAK